MMATNLAEKLKMLDGIKITQSVQSNGVFAIAPALVAETVRKHTFFYPWNESTSEYRFMCSWDTTEDDINDLIALFKENLRANKMGVI
jgi:threonine aldolase